MIEIDIPGSEKLAIEILVLDYNGTIAEDGDLIEGVDELIQRLNKEVNIHVITADTHGTVSEKLEDLPCKLEIIGAGDQVQAKLEFVKSLNSKKVVAIGNGRNDVLMLKEACLGIGVIQAEGASTALLKAADIVCTSIHDAFHLLLCPTRIQATLRV